MNCLFCSKSITASLVFFAVHRIFIILFHNHISIISNFFTIFSDRIQPSSPYSDLGIDASSNCLTLVSSRSTFTHAFCEQHRFFITLYSCPITPILFSIFIKCTLESFITYCLSCQPRNCLPFRLVKLRLR